MPSSPDDPPPILPDDQTGSLRRFGVVDTFNPGSVAVGYSKIWAHPLSKTYQALNFSFSWNTSISHNDMSRPSIFVFDLPGVGDLLKKGLDYNPSAADDTKLGVGAFVTYKAVF